MKPTSGLTRREALKRGALFGGALVWTTPAVQAVGMRSALAADVSPGCLRYALKWEVDDNLPNGELTSYLPDEGIDALPIWTNLWVALGGKPTITETTEPESDTASDSFQLGPASSTETESTATGSSEVEGDEPTDGEGTLTTGPPEHAENEHAAEPGVDPLTGPPTGLASEGDEVEPAALSIPQSSPSRLDAPPQTPPGNCIEAPDDAINDDSAAGILTTRPGKEFMVYGDPEVGFYVAFPDDSRPADVEVFAAAKCGRKGDSCYEVVSVDELDHPTLRGYRQIFIPACDNLREISHIELIVDVCPKD